MGLTAEDLDLLRRSIDRVVAIELVTGEQFFAEIVIVVDEPPTPDVFLIRVEREPDGVFVAKDEAGKSILLADISRVAPLPGMDYPPVADGSWDEL
jgi:hypothetical protein